MKKDCLYPNGGNHMKKKSCENERKKSIKLAKYIEEIIGSCPLDMLYFEMKEGCEKICGREIYKCWLEWADRDVQTSTLSN